MDTTHRNLLAVTRSSHKKHSEGRLPRKGHRTGIWARISGQRGVTLLSSFPLQNLRAPLRRLADEKAHFGMRGLDIRRDPMLAQPLARGRPDRGDDDSQERPPQRV